MALPETASTHTTRALIDLRARILRGDLPGGTRLFEVALAEDLGISRTPVREAMSRLAEEGLLERVRGGGFTVRRFAPADVLDTIELRGVLEGTAARLAAERGVTAPALARLNALLADLDTCFGAGDTVDLERYSELNALFHDALADAAGSAVLRAEIARVTRLPFASPSAFLPDRSRLGAFRRSLVVGQAEHRALVEAIVARQGARAEAVAREHARAARRNVEDLFAHGADPFAGLGLVAG